MENVQFPVSASSFLEGVLAQSDRFSLREMVEILGKTALGEANKEPRRMKCSLKAGGERVTFSVTKTDNFLEIITGVFGSGEAGSRGRLCKKLLGAVVSSGAFASGSVDGAGTAGAEFSFPISMGAGDLAKVDFEKMDRKSLVSLKKKILEVMLGGKVSHAEKGRPVGGALLSVGGVLCVQLNQDQALGILKKSLGKLGTEQLVDLDSRLSGALTSLPVD